MVGTQPLVSSPVASQGVHWWDLDLEAELDLSQSLLWDVGFQVASYLLCKH